MHYEYRAAERHNGFPSANFADLKKWRGRYCDGERVSTARPTQCEMISAVPSNRHPWVWDRDNDSAVTFFALLSERVAFCPSPSLLVMPEHELKRAADEYLEECLERRTPPRVSELAENLGLSLSKLSNYFVAIVGVRPSTYLKWWQVQQAVAMMKVTDLDDLAIARLIGFGSRTTLFRAVSRVTGKTPGYFRKNAATATVTKLRPTKRSRRRRRKKHI